MLTGTLAVLWLLPPMLASCNQVSNLLTGTLVCYQVGVMDDFLLQPSLSFAHWYERVFPIAGCRSPFTELVS